MDGLVGQAEAFLRIVSEGPLDLIVAAHAKRCVDIAVASVKGVVPDEEQVSIHAALLSDSVWRAS